ncbi:hypothetical protein VTJ04DRAFT_8696 [Mycothermus thermophilus]|uniref:uncharacterized protein n=1 Tax=Humicola insolens TaxID=85995 RepID=UPI003741F2E8
MSPGVIRHDKLRCIHCRVLGAVAETKYTPLVRYAQSLTPLAPLQAYRFSNPKAPKITPPYAVCSLFVKPTPIIFSGSLSKIRSRHL